MKKLILFLCVIALLCTAASLTAFAAEDDTSMDSSAAAASDITEDVWELYEMTLSLAKSHLESTEHTQENLDALKAVIDEVEKTVAEKGDVLTSAQLSMLTAKLSYAVDAYIYNGVNHLGYYAFLEAQMALDIDDYTFESWMKYLEALLALGSPDFENLTQEALDEYVEKAWACIDLLVKKGDGIPDPTKPTTPSVVDQGDDKSNDQNNGNGNTTNPNTGDNTIIYVAGILMISLAAIVTAKKKIEA